MKTVTETVIERAAREMNLADEAGHGVIALLCDSDADARRVRSAENVEPEPLAEAVHRVISF